MRRERGSVAVIVQQRGGGCPQQVCVRADVDERRRAWGEGGRPAGTGDGPAAGTRADGRGHNGPGRTRRRAWRGQGFCCLGVPASANGASEPSIKKPGLLPLVPGWRRRHQGPEIQTDGQGQTRRRARGRRGSRRLGARASANRASEPHVKGPCLPLVPGGASAGGRGPGSMDGPGWTGR